MHRGASYETLCVVHIFTCKYLKAFKVSHAITQGLIFLLVQPGQRPLGMYGLRIPGPRLGHLVEVSLGRCPDEIVTLSWA